MSHTSTGFADTASPAYRAGSNKAAHLLTRAWGWVAEQRRINRTVATLSNLSDATLRDIGIERGDIERVARFGRGA